MPLGERDTVAQVDDPFTGRQPLGDLCCVGRTWRGEVDGSGARGVGRAHVRVVRRDIVQTGEQVGDEGAHVADARASLVLRSRPIVEVSPSAWDPEQKLPNPCVGSTGTSSSSSSARRRAEAYCARASCSVSRGSTRSGRPPYRSAVIRR